MDETVIGDRFGNDLDNKAYGDDIDYAEDNNNNGGMNPEPEITIQGVKDEEETKETGFPNNYSAFGNKLPSVS